MGRIASMFAVLERSNPGLTILVGQARVNLPHSFAQCSSESVESGAHQKSYRTVILNSGNHVRILLPKLSLSVFLFEPYTYNDEIWTLALHVKRLYVFWEVTQGRQVPRSLRLLLTLQRNLCKKCCKWFCFRC